MAAAWLGLVGAVVGGGIAFLAQYVLARATRRHEGATLLMAACAEFVALNADFRDRLWDERTKGAGDAVAGWDLGASRLAEVRIRLLTGDERLLVALDRLGGTGRDLGKRWHRSRTESDELAADWRANKLAQQQFTEAARAVLGEALR